MKMYRAENTEHRSWALKLNQDNYSVSLEAVDTNTGSPAATMLVFKNNGEIIPIKNVFHFLKKKSYNPYEHGNKWNEDGSIVIEYKNK